MEALKPNRANSCPLTPLGFLDRAAIAYTDSPAVVYGEVSYTWAETRDRCLRVASSIVRSLGIERGQVVSVVAPNVPAMYELQFAVPMAGAILNNINTRLDARTVSSILTHAGSKLVFVDAHSKTLVLDAVAAFPSGSPVPLLVLIEDDDEDGDDEKSIGRDNRFVSDYESLVEEGDSGFRWVRPESEWDPMVLNYTSGTTASPKGVVHHHRGAFVVAVDSLVDWGVPKHPVYLWTLPIFHSNGWAYPWGMAAVGGTNICVRKFTGPAVFTLIRRHRVTHMCCAPVVLNMLANCSTDPLGFPVHVMTGGSPPPPAVLHRSEALGFVVSHGYGMTECMGVVISCAWKAAWDDLPAPDRARLKARQGVRTATMAEIDVVDPVSGSSVKRDGTEVGEVVLRGGCVMLGYLKNPGATNEVIKSDGWFYTGDVGVMHSDGYLEIKDRSKDVIISGGENVSSVEVEAALYAHPAVREAAVVARPDDFWGETPCAFVTLKAALTEEEIVEHCRQKLPRYMVPKTVCFEDELPKTSTGKIQKFVLKGVAKNLGSPASVPRSQM